MRDLRPEPRRVLLYVARHETPAFGVIVRAVSGQWLIRRGLAEEGQRRSFARETGMCIRLTEAGRAIAKEYGE